MDKEIEKNDDSFFQIIESELIKNNKKDYLLTIASNKSRNALFLLIQQSSYFYFKKLEDFKEINFLKKFNLSQSFDIMIKLFKEKKDSIILEEEENKQIKLSFEIELSINGTNLNFSKEKIEIILNIDNADQIIKNDLIWHNALFLLKEIEKYNKFNAEQINKIDELTKEKSFLKNIIEYLQKNNNLNNKIINFNEKDFNNSQIINELNKNQLGFIKKKINYNNEETKIKFRMLYSAKLNGDSSKIFHKLCDNHFNTLVLVKTDKENVFGGFASKSWNSMELGRKKDLKSFIFSLNKKKIYSAKKDKKFHLYCSEFDGPCFYAFSIEDFCLKNGGFCDEVQKCNFDSFQSDYEINNGNKKFVVDQLEVFEILIEK
jgi:hypothetical protein